MQDSRSEVSWLSDRLQERATLSAPEIEAIHSLSTSVRAFEPGQYLLREGDRPKLCSFLLSGFVYRHKIVGSGGRQIVAIHLPRDFIDMQQALLSRADHNVQALTSGAMLSIQADELIARARQHPALSLALFHHMLVEASILREWLVNTNRRDARTRTAHMLCELAVRSEAAGLGERDVFELPMTQEQLGDSLGLTSVHVNRTLKTLSADKLIARDKRAVRITDWKSLASLGDFNTGYLHLRERRADDAY